MMVAFLMSPQLLSVFIQYHSSHAIISQRTYKGGGSRRVRRWSQDRVKEEYIKHLTKGERGGGGAGGEEEGAQLIVITIILQYVYTGTLRSYQ